MEEPIEMPDKPGLRELSFTMDSAVARSPSPFTLTEQVYVWPGQRWLVVCKLPTMKVEEALAWQAWFADLNVSAGSFYVREASFVRTTEIGFGMPETDGVSAAGPGIDTRGWTPNMERVLRKGQKIELAGRIRSVIQDVDADQEGKARIRLWPAAGVLPDGVPINWQDPRGVFRLLEAPEFTWNSARLQQGFQFSAQEVILP